MSCAAEDETQIQIRVRRTQIYNDVHNDEAVKIIVKDSFFLHNVNIKAAKIRVSPFNKLYTTKSSIYLRYVPNATYNIPINARF